MTRKEAERQTHQENVLMALGFTKAEAESLRRISMTLRRWHELECGTEAGCIERENDDGTGRPFWASAYSRCMATARHFIPDREKGAQKRLANILKARNGRERHAGEAGGRLTAYVQTDPRGAALYILRPGDVPAGESADAYYTRGICVY